MGQPQGGPWVEESWGGLGKCPWAYLLISLPSCQIHHAAGQQAGDGQVTSATHCHQCCVLALGGHQIQEERSLHRCHRVRQPAGEPLHLFPTPATALGQESGPYAC